MKDNIIERNKIAIQLCRTVLGLFIFAFGVYMTISADIGLAPWDVLATGVSYHSPLSFGNALTMFSFIVLLIDMLLREKIGFGTIIDALLVGNFVDMFTALKIIRVEFSIPAGVVVFIIGMFIMAFGQYFYMSSSQGCGPRDTLLIGLGKRMRKLPIGIVNTMIFAAVLAGGRLLGGPVGIGTILGVAGMGVTMQITFKMLNFEPRDVIHKNAVETIKLFKSSPKNEKQKILQ